MIRSSQKSGSIFHIDHAVESRLLKKMNMKNGLTLEMFDKSRSVAGDRWQVSFEASIEIKVKREYFQDQHKADVSFEDIRNVVGETVLYRYENVWNFIAETEKDETLREIMNSFLNTTFSYLSSRDFPHRLILRKYKEILSPANAWKR